MRPLKEAIQINKNEKKKKGKEMQTTSSHRARREPLAPEGALARLPSAREPMPYTNPPTSDAPKIAVCIKTPLLPDVPRARPGPAHPWSSTGARLSQKQLWVLQAKLQNKRWALLFWFFKNKPQGIRSRSLVTGKKGKLLMAWLRL